jgi:hypothetical protein
MNQANQKQVIQEANMNLVQIRQYELEYFSTFFSNFGTQAALMIGFIAGSLSQVPGTENPTNAPYFFVMLYWVTSAACMATGMHALVCSVFLQVFGQGLALRGPVGSMVRAVEGMVAEQEHIFYAFVWTIFFFGLQAIGMYWLMMDQTSAIVTSILTAIGMVYWYRYSLRVYNRFSWNKNVKLDWNEEEDPEEELNDLNPNALNMVQGGKSSKKKGGGDGKNVSFANGASSDKKSVKGDGGDSESDGKLRGIDKFVAGSVGLSGGYLTIKGNGIFGRDPWERKFFVIRGTLIYYYKDKRSFELEPQKPINLRPIELEGYTMIAGAVEPPYAITLAPIDPDDIRKAWKFRCDTLTEFNNWIEIFNDALRMCDSSQSIGDLIKVSDGKSEVLSRAGDRNQDDEEEEEDM